MNIERKVILPFSFELVELNIPFPDNLDNYWETLKINHLKLKLAPLR